MPKIRNYYEGADSLIVIEEYIPGTTLEHTPEQGHFPREEALRIVIRICRILDELHHLEPPMVHRDVKPSNIILAEDGEVWLLDVNVAKWHDPEETRDTRYMGTENYAAPEQVGYGMKASSPKTDIYAVGMLLNVMLTGAFPKDRPTEGPLGNVIQRCISLNAEERYTAAELTEVLEECLKGNEYYGT